MEAEARRKVSKANTKLVKSGGSFVKQTWPQLQKGWEAVCRMSASRPLHKGAKGAKGIRKRQPCEKAAARREALKQIAAACRLKWR